MKGKRHEYLRQIATTFYVTYCPERLNEVEYIDFDYPVRDVAIEPGTVLWGFKDPRISPLKSTFFAPEGTPIDILGVLPVGSMKSNPTVTQRVLNRYEVVKRVPHALLSVCADGIDAWSLFGEAKPVQGGGWQYKIPKPERYLRYTTPSPLR